MKKLFLALMVITMAIPSVKAQEKMSSNSSLSLGVEASLPIGDFNDAGYNFGIGGSLQGEYKPAGDLGLTLNAGFINYFAKETTIAGVHINGKDFGIIPVMAGAKYYFSPKVYAHGQLGAGFGTTSGSGTFFTYTPGIGAYLSNKVDLMVKFVGYSKSGGTWNSIGARLAYNFGK